jgi:hypothetical protein
VPSLRRWATLSSSSSVDALPGRHQFAKVFLRDAQRSAYGLRRDGSIGFSKYDSLSLRVEKDHDAAVRVLDMDVCRFMIASEHCKSELSRDQYGRHCLLYQNG